MTTSFNNKLTDIMEQAPSKDKNLEKFIEKHGEGI